MLLCYESEAYTDVATMNPDILHWLWSAKDLTQIVSINDGPKESTDCSVGHYSLLLRELRENSREISNFQCKDRCMLCCMQTYALKFLLKL